MNGNVTDIQRFSLNDGDGIRTTVFLKGCNMQCKWCHNPETIKFKNDILLYESNCIHCGKCFEVCPQGAHLLEENVHILNNDKCIGCGKCVDVCYAEALKFTSKSMGVEEVMFEVVQDKAYYEKSGGGVTISGGEVFCQSEFAEELIDACKVEGISVAVETNLLHNFESIEHIIKKLDMVMFDIKLFDREMHKKYTGVDNEIILENAKKLDELGIPLIVRTPLIPNVTDTDENLLQIAEFSSGLKNIKYYELLNFNPLGESKYRALNTGNEFLDARPLTQKQLDRISELLKAYKIKIS